MSNIIAYHYKSISLNEVGLHNHIFQKDPGLTFQLGSDSYTVHFVPDGNGAPLEAPLTAHVRVDDHIAFELLPEAKLLTMTLSHVVSAQDLRTLSEEIRCVVLESCLERLLDHIDQLGDTRSTIERVIDHHKASPTRPAIYFMLTRQKDGCRGRGCIRTNFQGLQWISARMRRLTAKSFRPLNHVPAIGYIEIADIELTRAEISALESNDIILVQRTGSWEDHEVCIRFSHGLALTGNMVEANRILIQNVMIGNGERDTMPKKKKFAAKPSNLPVDDIPVKLVFEIGRTDIPMGELRRMQPGYTIQLDESIDIYKPVTVIANGVAMGNGEVVLIDDHIGIRIMEFNKEICSF